MKSEPGLKITRKIKEKIVITTSDGPIVVEIVSRKGNTFLFNINAPDNVGIHRLDPYFYEKAQNFES